MNDEPINRVNWTLLNDYIDSLRKEGVYSEKTLAAMRNALMKFIVYAGMTPIAAIEKVERESFTAFLYNLKSEITDTRLEFEYRRKILEYTKRFLLWLRKKKKINTWSRLGVSLHQTTLLLIMNLIPTGLLHSLIKLV